MESKCPDKTLRMRDMNLNLCMLRMREDTFSLEVAQVVSESTELFWYLYNSSIC